MAKTLVTLGYHYGELDWGRQVRDEYIKAGLKGNRDITFHEVKNSQVETGDIDLKSLEEIEGMLEKDQLWIDIHCGFNPRKYGKIELIYRSIDPKTFERVKLLPDVWVGDNGVIPDHREIHPYCARADVFFSREEYETQGKIWRKGLDRTLIFVNQLHDLHYPKPPSRF